ncbi:SDR family oxidoreductase [Novosphingobium sp. BL-8H]|uniref:SDR family NAD(P)-dependent oxidoreductase n=1 Tax=Novosphingobium sp. BL-8H TaxID=3127640 RepID=UPI003756581F
MNAVSELARELSSKAAPALAVVTGAGRGLGRALVLGLVAGGHDVVGLGPGEESLAETGALATGPGRYHPMACDVSDIDALRRTFGRIRDLGAIAILINNAAVYPRRDFLDESIESFQHTLAVNLGGMAACCRLALDDMVERGSGRIINVTSFADIAPIPASSAYSVSKGASRLLTRALVADLADRFPGIVISDWAPGALQTRMGIVDGLAPEVAAQWGVELALARDPSFNGTLWERDMELLPHLSLKRRLFNRLTLRPPVRPRRLASAA